MQRILTIIGARPQFIKASVVSRSIKQTDGIEEIMLHTGQHFDANMSDIFFNQLSTPRPDIQLDIHGGSYGEVTGRMLSEIEQALLTCKPDRVLVYGDTNSTLAGALAAAKLHIPVAHVEAGLRSFNTQMPEEINRILTDQISDLLFCPTEAAVKNLNSEGFANKPVRVLQAGDVMRDIAQQGLDLNVHLIDPVGYFEMVWLLDHSQLVLTDSGGVQKEAFFFGKACVTMRDQTEWVELIEAGANELVGADAGKIVDASTRHFGRSVEDTQKLYGGGEASQRIVAELFNKA